MQSPYLKWDYIAFEETNRKRFRGFGGTVLLGLICTVAVVNTSYPPIKVRN